MKPFAAFAALVASLAAIAGPASAATSVRVSLTDKSPAQIDADIKTAAKTVCAPLAWECVDAAVRDANRQLVGLMRARDAKPAAVRATEVRLSLAGKSDEQIHAEIRAAAETVCASSKDYAPNERRVCVGGAIRAAKAQLAI
ncbi:hypothetical protein [Caulobacter hibisci]|uniref:hypothetical protein n=1 Tax=Caulobacter hibisci TaxID=2035993 RepID=UPI001E40EF0C|nr:hypothetical protein [Caulobacter hibisci]